MSEGKHQCQDLRHRETSYFSFFLTSPNTESVKKELPNICRWQQHDPRASVTFRALVFIQWQKASNSQGDHDKALPAALKSCC